MRNVGKGVSGLWGTHTWALCSSRSHESSPPTQTQQPRAGTRAFQNPLCTERRAGPSRQTESLHPFPSRLGMTHGRVTRGPAGGPCAPRSIGNKCTAVVGSTGPTPKFKPSADKAKY